MIFKRVKESSNAIIFCGTVENLKVLLVKRQSPPFKGELAFPGDIIDHNKTPYQSCLSELQQATGIAIPSQQTGIPLSIRKRNDRDPRGSIICHPFLFWFEDELAISTENACWIEINKIDHLAFDHGAILCEAISKLWHGMPSQSHSLITTKGQMVNSILKHQEIIFFGSSFNPLHQGHLACISLCLKKIDPAISKLVVFPDFNPLKKAPGQICFWNFFQKIVSQIKDLTNDIYPGFCGIETANPTYSWLSKINQENRQLKLSLLIGEDSFESLKKWVESEKLIQLIYKIYLTPRRGDVEKINEINNWIKQINPNLQIIKLEDHDYEDLSSTNLR